MSPCRAKPNQQPVSSVAQLKESRYAANNSCEAYTENNAGRRGYVHPSSNSAPLQKAKQLATVLTSRKPARRNRRLLAGLALSTEHGEIPEGLPGSKSMACIERSTRNLGDPSASSQEVGQLNRKKSVRRAEGSQIIS